MPTTLSALIVLAVAVVPGFLAEGLFARLRGSDWREKEWRSILRMLAFSVGGLTLYLAFVDPLSLPHPDHVSLTSYTATSDITRLVKPYLGHIIAGLALALLAHWTLSILTRITGQSWRSSTWAQFIRDDVAARWVIVTLTSGDKYVGILHSVEVDWGPDERDLVLREPALWVEEKANYISTGLQLMYLPSAMVTVVATSHDPDIDPPRLTKAGEQLYSKGIANDHDKADPGSSRTQLGSEGPAGKPPLAHGAAEGTATAAGEPTPEVTVAPGAK